jgi:EmrB/QacA subfamily drug resistance transporter
MNDSKEKQNITLKHLLIIATIGIAPFLGNLDGSIVMIASPTLEKVFTTNTAGVSLIIISYLLITASCALIFGRLGDMKGPANIFMVGFGVITVGSLLCGLSNSLHTLVAFRLIQAVGSAMLFSTYCAVVATTLPASMRGRAFGFVGVMGSIGFAVGAPLGGFFLKYLSWRWLFLFNIPFGIAGLVLSYKFLRPQKSGPEQTSPFDIWGGLLSLICLCSFVYALHHGQDAGWENPYVIGLFCFSMACFVLFIAREKRFSAPLIDISIFNNTYLSLAALAAILVIILLNGVLFLFPYFFELVKGLSPEKAGLILMALPIAVFVFCPLAGYLTDKKSPRWIASIAVVCILLACSFFMRIGIATPIEYIIAFFVVFGISLAFFTVSNMTLVMSNAEEGKQGIISAILSVINSVGALMGVTFFQIVFSHVAGSNAKAIHLLSPEKVTAGFNHAMILAVIICVPALLASIFAKKIR